MVLRPNYDMSIEQKKYKRLRKELQFVQSELEYVYEVLSEWHFIFEDYHREYCKKHNIDLNQLNKKSDKKIDQLIAKPAKKNLVLFYIKMKKVKMFLKSYTKK